MRFLTEGDISNSRLLRVILAFVLLYMTLLVATDALLFIGKAGMSYGSVKEYYLGTEDGFSGPVSYLGLLEGAHFHLFAIAFSLLLLNHLMVFTGLPQGVKLSLIIVTFLSGLCNILAGWLVRFALESFIYLKIAAFIIFHASYAVVLAASFFSLSVYNRKPAENGNGARKKEPIATASNNTGRP